MCNAPAHTCQFIIVPCYNEKKVISAIVPTLVAQIEVLASADPCDSTITKVLLLNGGSTDGTWSTIEMLSHESHTIRDIQPSRNRNDRNSVLYGLSEAVYASCNCAISIDANNQDNDHAMEGMLREYAEETDVVYGVRIDRATDTPLKRITAQACNKTMPARPLRWVAATGVAGIVSGTTAYTVAAFRGRCLTKPHILVYAGAQILAAVIVGDYVGKTYAELIRRPRWVVARRAWK